MQLIEQNIRKLLNIKQLLKEFPLGLYTQPKEILSQSSIGQHFRHILEFYICLTNGLEHKVVCYDDRKRDIHIETDLVYAVNTTNTLITFLQKIQEDEPLTLLASYTASSDEKTLMQTSFYRELAYALDHTVHHLAIIKIALAEEQITLDSNFGIAPSTIRYRQTVSQ